MKLLLLLIVMLAFGGMAFAQYPPPICPPYCASPPPGPWYCDFMPWLKGCQVQFHAIESPLQVPSFRPAAALEAVPDVRPPAPIDVDRPEEELLENLARGRL